MKQFITQNLENSQSFDLSKWNYRMLFIFKELSTAIQKVNADETSLALGKQIVQVISPMA